MSSMLCQGLQSCFEPHLVEPRGLGLKMIVTKSLLEPIKWAQRFPGSDSDSDTEYTYDENTNTNIGDTDKKDTISKSVIPRAMSFLQALENSPQTPASVESEEEKKEPYVHPLIKKFSCKLSERSLELCTETLGCETGSDYSDTDINSLSSSNSKSIKVATKSRYSLGCGKANYGSFPPPLTSISGSRCVNIRPHREDGRLVMKAVVVPSSQTNFQAERCNGRLTLRFIENDNSNQFDSEATEEEKEQPKQPEQLKEHKELEEQEQEQEHKHEHEHEHEENENENENEILAEYLEEEIDGINESERGEMGIRKFERPNTRCKESGRRNKRLMIWEPCWVATS